MLRIKKPRNFNWPTLFFVSLVGTLAGIYIYNPLLKRYVAEELEVKKKIQKAVAQKKLMLICVGALSSLTFIVLGYRMFVSPYFKRKSYLRNEEFANYVFEQERKEKKISNESNG